MRKLKLKEKQVPEIKVTLNIPSKTYCDYFSDRPQLIGIKKKLERRETNRERKAEAAARIEKSIEKELIDRLKSKAYGDAPLNVNEEIWQKILDEELEGAEEDESDEDDENAPEEEEEEEDEVHFYKKKKKWD